LRKLKSDFASRLTSVHTRSAVFPSRRSPNDVAERLRRRASRQYTHYRARSTSAQPQVDVFWRFILPLRSRISSGWQSRRFRRRLKSAWFGWTCELHVWSNCCPDECCTKRVGLSHSSQNHSRFWMHRGRDFWPGRIGTFSPDSKNCFV